MSENLLIAIIGLTGAVLAALIGAFGAIAAAEIKGKGKAQDKSTGGCGMIGLAASFAGAIGLVLGLLFATSLVQQLGSATPKPTAPPTLNGEKVDLILADATEIQSSVRVEGDQYILQVSADRSLPSPQQLSGGGRIDFIWFIDADKRRDTGQSSRGNDYNIHLFVDEEGWGAIIFPVSDIALSDEVNRRRSELSFTVEGQNAEISFPMSILPNDSFRWWLEVSSLNASPEWRNALRFTVSIPEREFVR